MMAKTNFQSFEAPCPLSNGRHPFIGVRDYSIRNTIKLRDLVEAMIDDGAAAIRSDGASYAFEAEAAWGGKNMAQVEYVVAEEYRSKVDGLTAAMTGAGKRGKVLAETLRVGAQRRGIS